VPEIGSIDSKSDILSGQRGIFPTHAESLFGPHAAFPDQRKMNPYRTKCRDNRHTDRNVNASRTDSSSSRRRWVRGEMANAGRHRLVGSCRMAGMTVVEQNYGHHPS
jgi:hypothetical protein